MNGSLTMEKAERLSKTKGWKGWIAMFSLLAMMCFDQFILDIPFENIVFPVLIVCAASMSAGKNLVLVTVYSVIFELSCVAWFPEELLRVQWWLLEVWIGYMMPFAVYKILNAKHKNVSIWSYAAMATVAELLYFWVSIVATVILWQVEPSSYILSDLPYQAAGCAATFVCALPVAAIYKWHTGELRGISFRKGFQRKVSQ